MEGRLSRRQFLLLSGQGLAAVAVLAACAPAAEPTKAAQPASASTAAPTKAAATPAPKAPVSLDYLVWGDTADIPAWEQICKLYMERYPHATIKQTVVADPGNNFYPKLQTMIAGGTPPHISGFQGWEWQTYADKGLLQPIDDYVARDKFTAPFPSGIGGAEQSTKRKGKLYLVPMQIATMLMFYAKKPFDEAGIPYPTNDWTFEQFLDIAKKLTKTSGTVKMFGYQANGSWFRDISWILLTGKREFDSVEDPKRALFSTPEVAQMVQIVASDVYNTLKVSPTAADTASGANVIETGNCAMKYEGAWYFPKLNTPELREQKKQVEFDVVLMPKGADAKRTHRAWLEGLAIPKTKLADDAWDFVHFAASEEADKIYSQVSGRLPNTMELVEKWWIPMIQERFQVKNGKAFIDAFKVSQIDVISGVPRSKMWSQVVKPVGWDPLMAGTARASEVLPKVDAELQKLLDEYWATQK